MILHIKNAIVALLLFGSFICSAQIEKEDIIDPEDTIRVANMKNLRPRLLALSLDLYQPIPSGDQFVGQALNGKISFNFNAQMYIYRQFFIKVSVGANYFDVENTSVVGNYQKSTFTNESLSLGYEFLPFEKIRLGLSASVLGNSNYTNKIISNSGALQRDTAKLNSYGLYLDYEVFYYMAVSFNYSYRNDRTNIQGPEELKSTFERAQFHNVGIGVKFYFDDSNLFH